MLSKILNIAYEVYDSFNSLGHSVTKWFSRFLIQKSKLWGEVVMVVVWVLCDVPAAIFFSTMPGQQSVVLISTSPA